MDEYIDEEEVEEEDPFVRQAGQFRVRQFRYLRAQFEDDTLRPGEVPELLAESGCAYNDKDFVRFKDELKFTCCYHEAGFILRDALVEQVNNEIISPVVYCKFFDQMQVCKIPKLEQGPLIDKQISTLWARYVEEYTEQDLFPECCGIGFMRNSRHFAFVFCFHPAYDFPNAKDPLTKDSFDFRYFGRYLLGMAFSRHRLCDIGWRQSPPWSTFAQT